jgi:hypothetical protein
VPDVLDERALMYVRQTEAERVLVALNFKDEEVEVSPRAAGGDLLLSSHVDREARSTGPRVRLRANEGVVIQLH